MVIFLFFACVSVVFSRFFNVLCVLFGVQLFVSLVVFVADVFLFVLQLLIAVASETTANSIAYLDDVVIIICRYEAEGLM
jgi:hypothetical protein